MLNLLLTGIGCPGANDIIKCAKKIGNINIIGTDIRSDLPAKNFVDSFELTYERENHNFINQINTLSEKYKIDVIWPLPTFDQNIFSKNKNSLSNYKLIISSENAINICNNKFSLLQELSKNLPTIIPKTKLVKNKDQL